MRTSAVFGAKNLELFRNLWCVRTDKEEGLDFSRFCAGIFKAAPYTNHSQVCLARIAGS